MNNNIQRIWRLLPIVVTTILIALAAPSDWHTQLPSVSWLLVLAAGVASLTGNYLWGALRWFLLLRANPGAATVAFPQVLRNWIGLYPLTFFMPFQLGTAGYVVVFQRLSGHSWRKSLSIVGLEKLISLSVLLLFCAPAVILHARSEELTWVYVAVMAALLTGIIAGLRYLQVHLPGKGDSVLFWTGTILCQATDIISMLICGYAMGLSSTIRHVALAAAPISLAGMLPVAHEGIGIRELASVELLGPTLGEATAYVLALFTSSVEYLLPALAGSVCIGTVWQTIRKPSEKACNP